MKNILKGINLNNPLKLLIYIGVALILTGGSSFAYLNFFIEGNETNLVKSGCLEVSFTEKNNINITNQAPISDDKGKESVPYTFTLKNSCDLEAYYETTFNVLTTSGINNESKVKLYLTGDNYFEPSLVNSFRMVELTDKPSDVRTSYLIDSGYLKQGESKTFNLRMWIDFDATSFDNNFNNRIIVTSIADKGPSFDEKTTGYQVIGRTGISASTISNPNYSNISPSTTQLSGLYKIQGIDNSYTYYYRGDANNYFKFGKYAEDVVLTYKDTMGTPVTVTHNAGEDILWRIIRINENGSLRLILEDFIGTSVFNSDASIKYYDDSVIKTAVDNWYNVHLKNLYERFITNTNFCLNKTHKMINNYNYYSSYTRNITSNNPTLACDESDIYVSKVGLLSADELALAGNVYNTSATSNYLYKNVNGWYTLSPGSLSGNELNNIVSRGNKSIDVEKVTTNLAVRPVISIGSNYLLSGDGTRNNPYMIESEIKTSKVLTIDANGGTYAGSSTAEFNMIEGEKMILEVPVREGYELVGWTVLSGTGSGVYDNIFTMGSTDTYIRANWTLQPKLTIDTNGGTYSGETELLVSKNTTVTLSVPIKTDYTFAGWEVSGDGTTTNGDTVTIGTSDSSATAKWIKTVNTYAYTGSAPTTPFTALPGSYQLEVYGAQGGGYSSGVGGNGAYTKGTLTLTEDTNLYVYVGGAGTYSSSNGISSGGFNGGGNSGYGAYAGSGGGATDIRIDKIGTSYRVIVAGGGGGGGYYSSSYYGTGGTGGSSGSAGYNKYYSSSTASYGCGQGASSSAGGSYGYYSSSTYGGSTGSFGTGGSAATASSTYSRGGGGGGGWYGGGGAGYRSSSSYYYRYICGGGGGSSYAYTTTNSASSLDSKYYLTGVSYASGARSGNGTATITVLSIEY